MTFSTTLDGLAELIVELLAKKAQLPPGIQLVGLPSVSRRGLKACYPPCLVP